MLQEGEMFGVGWITLISICKVDSSLAASTGDERLFKEFGLFKVRVSPLARGSRARVVMVVDVFS